MTVPILLIPGLNATATLFSEQIDRLATERSVTIACHTRHADIRDLAQAVLEEAPPRFVLGGLSMGGYVAFEILRQAADRVAGLILMDTTARPDGPEAIERRERLIGIASGGRFAEIPALQIPMLVAPGAVETLGPVVRAHGRGDRRGGLHPAAARDPVAAGFQAGPADHRGAHPGDRRRPRRDHAARARAGEWRTRSPAPACGPCRCAAISRRSSGRRRPPTRSSASSPKPGSDPVRSRGGPAAGRSLRKRCVGHTGN